MVNWLGIRADLLAGTTMMMAVAGTAHAQTKASPPPDHDTVQAEPTQPSEQPPSAGEVAAGDIVVTASRQSQLLSRVPLSVSAFTQETLDNQGVKSVADVQRLTPGVAFSQGGQGTTNISVRGIASSVGAATTAIYIDDTPVQVRTLGFSASNPYPTIFDLQRVEVLRGPQGTLFGAGAEGGAIRFITPQPDLTGYSGYARAEVATTQSGAASYEAGAAVGGPLIADRLAFRLSAFFRHSGGYIDKIIGTPSIVDRTGAAGPTDSLHFDKTGTGYADVNWENTTALRGALTWAPTDNLTITPALFYQKRYVHDATSSFWPETSDYASGDFSTPQWVSTIDADHIAIENEPLYEPLNDKFLLPSLNVEWDFGGARLISNTSYFSRRQTFTSDYTTIYERIYAGRSVPVPGDRAITFFGNDQDNFVQEVRLQAADPDARFNWVVGAYFADTRQLATQEAHPNFIYSIPKLGAAVTDGAPFGPGYSAFVNYYGIGLIDGVSYKSRLRVDEQHLAGFAQADFKITDRLKATVGVRVERAKFSYDARYSGANLNQNAPHGLACVPNSSPCVPVPVGAYAPGEGPFAPAYGDGGSSSSETPVTPKFGLSYQADQNNLFYVSATKGYRIGGAQSALPTLCNAQLAELGFTGSPATYKSDSLWSYEAGAKSRLAGGAINLAASAFYIRWRNIQTSVSLSSCANSFVANAASASSRGFDVQVNLNPLDSLSLNLAVGHTLAKFDEPLVLSGKTTITEGSAVPNSGAPWTVTASAQYMLPVGGDIEPFIRGDLTYNSRQRRTGSTDPGTISYDPMMSPVPENTLFNARVGGTFFDRISLSLFMDNVFNAHPHLGLSRSRGQPIYTDYTFRPRTIGVTISSNF
ncbi:outer membrane receptor protein involved in Fe transport [Hephaestia caeni]|uniref:Outer membrane receptor protein involved in Fe transport n=1 Tax=Hephaestia caeni TaxID=645617 RepID=A0A397NLY8_9SPHN|nr:TonB-dependent receptor [Hephaestia caeni]RIA36603.1 outer membrane receptor protein involved in Fe transport [Hephaestia caeni]